MNKLILTIGLCILFIPIALAGNSGQYSQEGKVYMDIFHDYSNVKTGTIPPDHQLAHIGYDYYLDNGRYKAVWKDDYGENYTVAVAFNNKYLRYKLDAFGYFDTTNGNIQLLGNSGSAPFVINNATSVRYDGIINGVDIYYTYENDRLKEDIVCKADCRNYLTNNLPASFGMSNQNSWLVWRTKLDFGGYRVYDGDVEITNLKVTSNNRIDIKNALGKILFYLPVGEAYDFGGNKANLTYRFEADNGDYYLYTGIRLLDLQTWTNPIIFDPTIVIINNDNVSFVVTPENMTCSGIHCSSEIIIHNSGDSNITFSSADIGASVEGAVSETLYFPQCTPSEDGDFNCDDILVTENITLELPPNENITFNLGSIQEDTGTYKYNASIYMFDTLNEIDPYYIVTESSVESTTTSITYQDKIDETVTVNEAGNYVAIFRASVTSGNTATSIFARSGINGTYYTEYIAESSDANPANDYPNYVAMIPFNISEGGTVQLELQYRAETAATTARIQDASIHVLKMNEYEYFESTGGSGSTTSGTYDTLDTLTFTPSSAGKYLIMANGRLHSTATGGSPQLQVTINDTLVGGQMNEQKDETDRRTFGIIGIFELEASTYNIDVDVLQNLGFGIKTVDNVNIFAIRFEDVFFRQEFTETTTTSATLVSAYAQDFIPFPNRDYLVMTGGTVNTRDTADSNVVETIINGISQECNFIKECKDDVDNIDNYTFSCFANVSFATDTSKTIDIQHRNIGGGISYMTDPKIVVIPFDDDNGIIRHDVTSSTTGTTDLTFSHTINNDTNNVLIVTVMGEGDAGDIAADNCRATNVTWGSTQLTRYDEINFDDTGADMCVSLWYALNPSVGTNNVVVDYAGTTAATGSAAISLYNVAQEPPEANASFFQTGITEIQTNITTLTNGSWLVDVVGSGNAATFTTQRPEQNIRWQGQGGATATGASSTLYVPTAQETFTQYEQAANRLAHIVTAWKPFEDNECNPTVDEDWVIDGNIVCNNVSIDIGTGDLIIGSDDSLYILNYSILNVDQIKWDINTSKDFALKWTTDTRIEWDTS